MTQPDIFDDDAPWAERLPELRLLLEAYASVPREARFTDSPEAPSKAMRSYLRIATYYPGRAFRVTAEILDTLKRGLDSPEVTAELATMPPIIVPEGQSKQDALVMMIPHLVAFTERGEQADPAVPETRWEWRQRLPNLAHLFGSYFHQDAAEEYPGPDGTADHDAIIADYLDTVIGDEAAATAHEIEELLGMGLDEAGLDAAETALGAGLLPPSGLSHENWLTQIALRLKRELQAQDYQKPENLNPAYPPHDKRAYPTR
jgi:hypothetical protein